MRADEEHVDAVALALGQLDGHERSVAAEHVLVCGDCRHEFDEVNSIVGELLPVVPAVQPRLGFDADVLQRLGIGTAQRRRRPRWWVLGIAAAAVVVVGLAVGGWLLGRSGGDSSDAARLQLADRRARRYGRRRGRRRSACDGRRHRRRAGRRLVHVPDQVGRWPRRRIAARGTRAPEPGSSRSRGTPT